MFELEELKADLFEANASAAALNTKIRLLAASNRSDAEDGPEASANYTGGIFAMPIKDRVA